MTAHTYPAVDPNPKFPQIEERVLASWKAAGTFRASVEGRPRGTGEYVFYDGPPFANGLPHYGHLLTGYVKDVVPRYHAMRGRRVERRFGWDCHGLPAEMESEKELAISGRQKIQEYGIERFNAHCRASVLKYTGEWRRYVTRQARWVDFDNDYKTMDLSYMESVMWAFKRLHEQGLVYEGFRVMPYSWAAQTPVSNFETRMDNAYREKQDPAVTVRFELAPQPGASEGRRTFLLAWTTTPWTLPSNLALAVGPDIEYALYEVDGELWILGASAAARYAKELGAAARVGTLMGRELLGRRYTPLFPYFREQAHAFRVLGGDFVSTEDGTGVVHMAPGFGEDDQRLCESHGIAIVCPVDDGGCFTAEVSDYAGLQVFEANKPILAALKARGLVVRHETILHNYPHCWRTDQPLIYRAMSSWYVEVTKFRERMVAHNQQIHWIPEHVRDGQFGKWLEGARDWSISRNRFWGSPIPIWKSDDPRYPRIDVYGSIAELERDFGVKVSDLHRPFVDQLVRPNPDDPSGKSQMRRVGDVLDCWFESGSMPFASVHYPFENKHWFEEHFPADFIVEYMAQTRGWFYTLVVLSTALFDKPPFRNVICHGVVLDEHGQKLSKRLRNYPDPEQVFATLGADALRWFLISSPILRGADLMIDKEGKAIGEVVRLVHKPIWNTYSFFTLYARADGVLARRRSDQQGLLDRYLLAKTRELVEAATRALDAYDLAGACGLVRGYLDALTNWYIRRSRERFWAAGASQDKQDAYDTLYTALETLCRVCAPLMPLLCEEIWRGLTGGASVHLAVWPELDELPRDSELVEDMDRARAVCSAALGLRDEKRLRVRLPLAGLTVAGAWAPRIEAYATLIAEELNVKQVRCLQRIEDLGSFDLKLNARSLGPKLGGAMKSALAAAKSGAWKHSSTGHGIELLGQVLASEDYELKLLPKAGTEGLAICALPSNDALVALDVRLTPELLAEGLARDFVRAVNQARKDQGFDVSDRIRLLHLADAPLAAAIQTHREWIREQTLAEVLEALPAQPAPPPTSAASLPLTQVDLEGHAVQFRLAKV